MDDQPNLDDPVGWLNAAARSGNSEAAFTLGWICEHGFLGVQQHSEAAAEWYAKAAAKDSAAAHARLAHLYEGGRGVEKSPLRAHFHAKRAASLGLPSAQYHLALMIMTGVGALGPASDALPWLERAAGAGIEGARQLLATLDGNSTIDSEKFQEQVDAAEAGDGHLAYQVGLKFLDGDGCPVNVPRAVALLRKAADAGVWAAAIQLSMLFGKGAKGVPLDAAESERYLELAKRLQSLE
jgi:TPR repeat protein